MEFFIFTGRNEVVAKVMFLLVSVILLTRGCLPQCMLGYHPLGADTPPGADTNQEQTPPRTRHPPQEQIPPTPQSRHPPEQTAPQEADSGIWSMSGRYTSYWNAFLLQPANEVWGKVIISQACVIPSVHRKGWGVGFPACITGHMTGGSDFRWRGISLLGEGASSWGVCIQGRVGQTSPPRYMGYYRIQSTNGRYASYCNAFLI